MNDHVRTGDVDFSRLSPASASVATVDGAGRASATRTRYRFVTLALITIVLALSSGDRAAMSVAGSAMGHELHISSIELGYIFSAFSWAYVIFMIPSGWLTDRIGSKKAMFAAVIVWSIFTVCMGLVHFIGLVVPVLLALRFLLGFAESPVGPGAARVIAAWFPSSERGVAGAVFNSAQYLSLALFTPLMGWLCHAFGWQYVFIIMGCIGIGIGFVWWRLYYVPIRHPAMSEVELDYIRDGGGLVDLEGNRGVAAGTTRSQWREVAALFKSRTMNGIFLGQYCVSAITWFFVTWFPVYLVKARGFDILQAGFVATIPALAGLIGGISSGFISDALLKRTRSLTFARKAPIIFGFMLSGSMILCNYTGSQWLVVALMSLSFFGKGFGALTFSVLADTAPREIIGMTGGVFNALGNSAGIVTPVVIGYLLHSTGSFNAALVYVGAHGLIAVASYAFIVREVERCDLRRAA